MRIQQKQINILLLFSLFILFCLPPLSFANKDETGKGKMKIKTDRILNDEGETVETELDKLFPDLFADETMDKVKLKQTEFENITNDLKQHIFHENLHESVFIDELKAQVFTEDYVARQAYKEDEMDESESTSSLVFYGSILLFIGIIGAGVVMILRKWEM